MVIERFPLSQLQLGMAFHHSNDEPGRNLEQIVISYENPPDLEALERAWRLEVQRQPVLRTAFRSGAADEVWQEVHDSANLLIRRVAGAFGPEELRRFLLEDRQQGIDIEQPPLMRLAAFSTVDRKHVLVWTVHHILMDGRSFVIVLDEVEDFYERILEGTAPSFVTGRSFRPYVDYVSSLNMSGEVEFWRQMLEGLDGPTPLPADFAPANGSELYSTCQLRLSQETSAKLGAVASSCNVTLNTIVMCAWGIVLSRHGGGNDLLFGATKSTRRASIPGADSMLGLFLNTIPMRMRFTNAESVKETLQRLRCEWLGIRECEHTPLTKIRAISGFAKSAPLFESLVVFEHRTFHAALAASREQWHSRQFELLEQTGYPLTLLAYGEPQFQLALEFDLRRYAPRTAQVLLERVARILEGIAEDPDRCVGSLDILTPDERSRMLVDWNATALDYPCESSLAELVEAQAARTPENLAVTFQDHSVTYQELNEHANQLARELVKHGVRPDQPVGICLERSIDMIIALLAVVKAGGGYVPLDPTLPLDRLAYMIEDSGLRVLVSQSGFRVALPPATLAIEIDDPGWKNNEAGNLGIRVVSEHLAYSIYTSGSTGKPKGVEVTQRNLLNLLYSMRTWLELTDRDCLLAVTTISFDIAGVDIWLPLLVGARTVIASRDDSADGERLAELIQFHGVTFLQATPVTWWLLLEAGWRGNPDLQMVCTGEAMSRDLAFRLLPLGRRLWNLYGPTETTIWSIGYLVPGGDGPILIGRPAGNTQCYILDDRIHPVPVGVVGELYIGGEGVARGYHNRPELTMEKFLFDPLAGRPGARMFRTGDLARYLPDGNIECLGRTDHQVKIRGFRIELGEIESLLEKQAGVKRAVVVAREEPPGDKRLVAYVVPEEGKSLDTALLAASLGQQLPAYMLPSAFVSLLTLPISSNGKIDRKALPRPDLHAAVEQVRLHASSPRNETESRLVGMFSELLSRSQVGVDDDFFDLGGHSLLAMRAIHAINREFEVDLPVRVLFQAQTPRNLAAIILASRKRANLTKAEQGAHLDLISIQPGGSKIPLFCVARPNVNALGYLFLARHLGADQPVYGLQKELKEDPVLDFTQQQYEATAQDYIRAVRSVQPHGPYCLAGQCQGANIAFEMARQLEASGEKIGLVAMLDVWPEENTRRKVAFFVYTYARAMARLAGRWRAHHRNTDAQVPLAEGIVGLSARRLYPNRIFELVRSRKQMWEKYWPGRDFNPPRIRGPIVAFRLPRQFIYRIRDRNMGWGNRTTGAVYAEDMSGDHLTFLREPHAPILARKLARYLAVLNTKAASKQHSTAAVRSGRCPESPPRIEPSARC